MNKMHFIGYAPQSDGVSVPVYAPAEAFPVCECGVNVCLGQCRCNCHYELAVKTLIKAVIANTPRMVSASDLLVALRVAAIAMPEDASEAWQFVADMRYEADKERGEG